MAQHSSKGARFQAVTANRLNDGEVVYYKNNGWIENFAEAEIADGQEAAEVLLSRACTENMEAFILDPYLFEVAECDNGFKPVSVRENIRANGPTVRTDLGKQAEAQ